MFSIVVVDRNLDGAELVASKIKKSSAICVKADVQSVQDLNEMANAAMDTFGSVNVLVNNAGARVIKGFLEHTREDWDTMLGINHCSQAIVPKMMDSGGGSIINVCSIASYMGRPNRCAYVAAKSGLLGLTRTMAIDLAPKISELTGFLPA